MGIITNQKIELNCPECNYSNKITLGDAKKGKKIICEQCRRVISFEFKGNDPFKAEKQLKRSIDGIPKKIVMKI